MPEQLLAKNEVVVLSSQYANSTGRTGNVRYQHPVMGQSHDKKLTPGLYRGAKVAGVYVRFCTDSHL